MLPLEMEKGGTRCCGVEGLKIVLVERTNTYSALTL